MRAVEFTVPAIDDLPLHGRAWLPDGAPRAVVLLVHGMAEHIGRYAELGVALAGAGCAAYGHDQRGHGRTAGAPGELQGHLADAGGWDLLLSDLQRVREHVAVEHPGTPLVVLGHSMGSLVVRCHLQQESAGLAAMVLSGTPADPGRAARLAVRSIAHAQRRLQGRRTRSQLLDRLTFGGYNAPFRAGADDPTGFEWLSRDRAEVAAYVADPACGWVGTTQFYADLVGGLTRAYDAAGAARTPSSLPVLVLSGADDPAGARGAAPRAVADVLTAAGVRDVTCALRPGARHEVFHETDRADAIAQLIDWLDGRLGG